MLPTIAVIAGTRPEAVKLWPVVVALRRTTIAEIRLIATGQHRALFDQILPVMPDIDLNLMQPGDTPGRFLARAASALHDVLQRMEPALVVVQGDTATAYAGAIAAFRLGIAIAHVEAGLRTASIAEPFPEELFRRAITRLAALHFAPTKEARQALLNEGVPAGTVHVTGNTGLDELRNALTEGAGLTSEATALLQQFGKARFGIATVHRRENRNGRLESIAKGLSRTTRELHLPLILPLHPAPDLAELQTKLSDNPLIHVIPPIDHQTMAQLLMRAALVLTDSGGLQEEAAALGTPVVVLRAQTERMEAVKDGRSLLAGSDADAIVSASTEMLKRGRLPPSRLFGDGRSAPRIAEIIGGWLNP